MFALSCALQRLFSTFANGWPGVGLLLQRLLTGSVLLHQGVLCLSDLSSCALIVPETVSAVAGTCLLLGLWTPVAGTLIAMAQAWILASSSGSRWPSVLLGALGATLSMIGPGAWSMDARLFGRRHIDASEL